MANAAAALLDELMGKSRNVVPGSDVKETEWWDSEVRLCGTQQLNKFLATCLF